MGERLCIKVLGGFDVRWPNGRPLTFATRKARALLAYLALSPYQPRAREQLAGLLWERSAEEQARASLRQTLTALRKSLSDDSAHVIVADADSVQLDADGVWVDALEMESLAAESSPENLQRVADLYEGELLQGFSLREEAFEEWLGSERRRVREIARDALTELLEHYETSGEARAGRRIAEQLLTLDPLQESAHRALMRLHAAEGRHGAALKQYGECVRIMSHELGVDPEAATTALYREILQHRSGEDATQALSTQRGESESSAESHEQHIHFCTTSDGVRIGYATSGEGLPLVKTANWLSHLEYDWESPVWRPWLEALSEHHTLVRYDERGCGLSDWNVTDFTLDAWVSDLEAVVEAAGLDRFPLVGISQGGPVAITYAVRHPEKVSHLVLYGTYARGMQKRGLSERELEESEALGKLIELGWGQDNPAFRQVFATLFCPEGTQEQHRWFNDLQRVSTSPHNAASIFRGFGDIDVTDITPRVEAPTLVLHATGDARIPFDEGRSVSALIPDSRFVSLESSNHILLDREPAWSIFLSEVDKFLQS
jgi:DNA-binding SARP family transcriptional activator/alpha-beta hydrolase superfamily lysophospholipase